MSEVNSIIWLQIINWFVIDLVKPKLIVDQSEMNVNFGQTITLTCLTEGNPKPKVTWFKVGQSENDNWLSIKLLI